MVLNSNVEGQTNLNLSVGHLAKGIYTMIGYNAQGTIKANAKLVKE